MSGIQIFTESPISSAVKNENSTATTSANPPQPGATATATTAPVTQSQQQTSPPQPSAAFAPQPTAFLPAEPSVNPPTPTVASYPQAQTTTSYAPPTAHTLPPRSNSLTPSQPGSPSNLETPSVPRSRSVSPRRDIPPPPKVGEKMKPVSYYSPAATPTYANQTASYGQGFPYQSGNTPNTATFAQQQQQGLLSPHPNGLFSPAAHGGAGKGMSMMTASPAQTPTTATGPGFQGQQQQSHSQSQQPANFEHPPGYVQNPYAADMTPEQRFASQQGVRSPSLGYNDGQNGFKSPNVFSSFAPANNGMASPGVSTGGGGGGRGGILDNGSDEGSYWGMVSGWAKTAGKKMSEVEGEVWKRINGEQ